MRAKKTIRRKSRLGAAAVEFALVAPVCTVLVLGVCEMGQAVSAATRISSAVREGGRLASMDFSGKLSTGQTANQKVEQDIINFLAASGISTDNVTLAIEHADGSGPFDLAAEDNYLSLFRITISVPYTNASANPLKLMGDRRIEHSTVFRRGRTPVNYN